MNFTANLADGSCRESLWSNLYYINWIVITLALNNWVLHVGVLPSLGQATVVPEDGTVIVSQLAFLKVTKSPRFLKIKLLTIEQRKSRNYMQVKRSIVCGVPWYPERLGWMTPLLTLPSSPWCTLGSRWWSCTGFHLLGEYRAKVRWFCHRLWRRHGNLWCQLRQQLSLLLRHGRWH